MNNSIYLGLSKLDLSKSLINEFWNDYAEPKNGEKAKLYYMDAERHCSRKNK